LSSGHFDWSLCNRNRQLTIVDRQFNLQSAICILQSG
jgi:hypothetical protein